jgi:hypothetical protein
LEILDARHRAEEERIASLHAAGRNAAYVKTSTRSKRSKVFERNAADVEAFRAKYHADAQAYGLTTIQFMVYQTFVRWKIMYNRPVDVPSMCELLGRNRNSGYIHGVVAVLAASGLIRVCDKRRTPAFGLAVGYEAVDVGPMPCPTCGAAIDAPPGEAPIQDEATDEEE